MTHDVAELVRQYGLLAIVVGTFFEGELVMVAAGIAARGGYLSPAAILAAGMTGIFCSDTLCFFIGRLAGPRLARWLPGVHARLGGVFELIERHDEKLIVCFQFFPGLCTATPVAFGMTRISTRRFMLLDLAGNALWTLTFTAGGYALGAALEHFLVDAQHWQLAASAAVVVLGLVWCGWRSLRRRPPAKGVPPSLDKPRP